MSAAFDIVDHPLLLQKLQLYGFDNCALNWMKSYLSERLQMVCIDGCQSNYREVDYGVPQGSILGPLLYTLFTNELPEVVHCHPNPSLGNCYQGEKHLMYNLGCQTCGGVVCYADDSTYFLSHKDPDTLSNMISEKYQALSEFLSSNRLKLNDEKTQLMVLTTSQKRRNLDTEMVKLNTPNGSISKSKAGKLLGVMLHEDLKWNDHIMGQEDSLLKSLSMRVAALRLLPKVASFKIRKIVANGIFMSKIGYAMPLWGGCSEFLIRSLQTIQSKAAKIVVGYERQVSASEALVQCGWLSVRQLSAYHTILLVRKVLKMRSPLSLLKMFDCQYIYPTRQAMSGQIKVSRKAELDLVQNSFRCRAVNQYNRIPEEIRTLTSDEGFKMKIKEWIRKKIIS